MANEWTMISVLNAYEKLLVVLDRGVRPDRISTHLTAPSILESAAHLMWMLEEIPDLRKFEKQMRWICFIQGALWAVGVLSVDEAIDHNTGLLRENKNG